MSVDLRFNRKEAVKMGVKFIPVTKEVPFCNCGVGLLSPECECQYRKENWRETQIGEKVVCPNGSIGYAILPTLFQCKEINQEIRAWFISNLKSSKIN